MKVRLSHPKPADLGLTAKEGAVLRALKTPAEIQEFVIDGLHANFEYQGDTLRSVRGDQGSHQGRLIDLQPQSDAIHIQATPAALRPNAAGRASQQTALGLK